MKKKQKGIILIISSAFFFALMMMFVRLAGDLPSFQKAFFRNAVAAVFSLLVLLKDKSAFHIPKGSVKYLVGRAVCGTVGILCNFYAIDRLVLADASILNKMSPFFAIVFSVLLLKEKVTPFQISVVTIAFAGSMLVIKPSFNNAEMFPALMGLLGGIGAGAAYAFVRKCGEKGVKGPFIVFFFSLFSCVAILPLMLLNFTHMSLLQLLYLVLAGLSAAGGQFTITAAYCYAPAREISVYDYSQIIFTSAIGFLLFGQVPDLLSIIGYLIIILMAVLMFLYNSKGLFKKELKTSKKS